MDREVLFGQALLKAKETAKEQGNCIAKEQVEAIFSEFSLEEEQLRMVYDYLKQHRIGVDEPISGKDYLSEEEIDYLEEYLGQLQELPEVTEGEKEAVTLSAMAGDPDAGNRLIQIFLPQVAEIAKLYAGQGVFLEDLIGEGNVAVAMGVSMLGALESAAEAEGMLAGMIMKAMEEFITENAKEVQKDQKIADKVNKVADRANELAKDLRRKVTVKELADETGMSVKAIEDAMRISADKIETLQREMS